MLKISWTEYKTTEEVLELVQEERAMLTTLRQSQKKWLRRVLCHDSLIKKVTEGRVKVIEGRMKGKKTPGRPGEILMDWAMKDNNMDCLEL